MLVGWHYLADDDTGSPAPASTFLDVAGAAAGMRSPERMVRPYFKGKPSPEGIARDAAAWHKRGCRVQLGNEPNLPLEGFGGVAADYADWFLAVANLCPPEIRLYYAGISPTGTWRDWYAHPMARSAIQRAHGLVVHAYGNLEQIKDVVWWVYRQFPDKPLWLGEFNFGAGQTVDRDVWARGVLKPALDWLQTVPTLEAATYFAWTWPSPDSRTPTPVDAKGTAIERVLMEWKPDTKPTPEGPSVLTEGVDISNNNGVVDFQKLAASGRTFGIAKACEDDAFLDRFLKGNLAGLKEIGWGRGIYHFVRPSTASPAASVTLLQRAADASGWGEPGDVVALDIEDERVPEGTSLHVWAAEWLDLAERVFGVTPWKYSGRWYTRTRDLEHDDLARYPSWWAAYQDTEPGPVTGWGPIRCWQYSADGALPGIAGKVDLNVFHGSLTDFKALGKPGAVEPRPNRIADALAKVRADLDELERAIKEAA